MPTPYYYYGHYLKPHLRQESVKTYTIAGLSLLTVFVFGLLAIAPTVRTIVKTREEVAALKESSASLATKINALEKARINYIKAQKYEGLIENQIHRFDGWGREVEIVSRKADDNRLIIKSLTPTPQEIALSLEGNYENLKNFMQSLEKERLSFSVESLTIENDLREKVVEGSLKIKISFF